jgi:hypothetical protein
MNKIIFIIILFYILFFRFNKNNFSNTTNIEPDSEAIRNLALIASELQTNDGLQIPGSLNVSNNIDVKGNLNASNNITITGTIKSNNFTTNNLTTQKLSVNETSRLGKINLNNAKWETDHEGSNKSYIVSDDGNYKALMIVGHNLVDGGKRRIQMYDDVTINGNLYVSSMPNQFFELTANIVPTNIHKHGGWLPITLTNTNPAITAPSNHLIFNNIGLYQIYMNFTISNGTGNDGHDFSAYFRLGFKDADANNTSYCIFQRVVGYGGQRYHPIVSKSEQVTFYGKFNNDGHAYTNSNHYTAIINITKPSMVPLVFWHSFGNNTRFMHISSGIVRVRPVYNVGDYI